MNYNVLILSACQALGLSGAPMMVLIGAIIGTSMAPYSSLATLPLAVMIIGSAVFSIPTALLMQKYGRRSGFLLGSCMAMTGSMISIYAITSHNFYIFCLASFLLGSNMAFIQQYRFAAAETVLPNQAGRAISFVLVGGIIAAFLGPELAKNCKDILSWGIYTGSFAALAGIYCLCAVLLLFLKIPNTAVHSLSVSKRPFTTILKQPLFQTAVMAGLVSYGVMTFIMTATPISMNVLDGYSLDQTAMVIQSHIVAMFLPSLFTGILIDRYGLVKIMTAGILLMIGCVLASLFNRHLLHYWTGLVCLGVGWNFLFVGATTLLTRSYNAAERFKVQAFNDFTVYGFQVTATLSAGIIIFRSGWVIINLITLPMLFLMLLVMLKIRPLLLKKQESLS